MCFERDIATFIFADFSGRGKRFDGHAMAPCEHASKAFVSPGASDIFAEPAEGQFILDAIFQPTGMRV
jgi:hypothetical protein